MISTESSAHNSLRDKNLRHIAPIIPYAAVVIGMYLFYSGWASMLLYHLGMVVVLTAARQWKIGRLPQSMPEILVGAGVAIGSALGGLLIYWLWFLIRLGNLDLAAELSKLGLVNGWWWAFIFYYVLVNPILEEIYWRGYLGSPASGPILNDAWFAGYHVLVIAGFVWWPWAIVSFAVLLAAGWFWRQLARYYGGVFAPIISHAAADASIMGAVYLLTI